MSLIVVALFEIVKIFFFMQIYFPFSANLTSLAYNHLSSKKVIVLDPGHGGKKPSGVLDDGATSFSKKLLEKDFNMQITGSLGEYLNKNKNFKVHFTREANKVESYISPTIRAAMANRNKADAFISIHANSGSTWRSGYMIIYSERSSTQAESFQLAKAMGMALRTSGFKPDVGFHRLVPFDTLVFWGLEKTYLGVLPYKSKVHNWGVFINHGKKLGVLDKNKRPAVLIEVGNLSNPKEELLVQSEEFQSEFFQAIEIGLLVFFNNG